MTSPNKRETITQLLDRLLDRGYTQAARQTIEAVIAVPETGALRVRLNQMTERAGELAAAGERWSADDPVLRALMAAVDDALRTQAALVNNGTGALIDQGVSAGAESTRTLALHGATGQVLAQLNAAWREPNFVRELVDVTLRPAWTAEMERFRAGSSDSIRSIMIRGVVEGQSPLATARHIRDAVANIPLYRANTIMRTAQLHAYRTATAVHQQANADIADRVIRIGTLDDRICLCCLALHGTMMQPGEVVKDHHNGRCGSILIVRGRTVNVRTGEQWLRDQPENRQRSLMGDRAYNAWLGERVQLQEFVLPYSDPVFGDMVRQTTLKDLTS